MEDILKAVKAKIEGQIALDMIVFLSNKMNDEVLCLALDGFNLFIHKPSGKRIISISVDHGDCTIDIHDIEVLRSL